MSTLADLPRQIHAGLQQHFKNNLKAFPLFIEGQVRLSAPEESYYELRIDGPEVLEVTNNEFRAYVIPNILCVTKYNETDFHRIHTMVGYAVDAFKKGILLLDNIGCLQRDNDRIEVHHFGRIEDPVDITQASVMADYWGCF